MDTIIKSIRFGRAELDAVKALRLGDEAFSQTVRRVLREAAAKVSRQKGNKKQ